jgi:hypothetical protein
MRLDLSIIYQILENNINVWRAIILLLEDNIDRAGLFFNEFFQIFKNVGPSISSNFAMLFLAHNIHFDIINLQRRILAKSTTLTDNEVKIICLTMEIISQFSRVTTKGSGRVFGENIPVKGRLCSVWFDPKRKQNLFMEEETKQNIIKGIDADDAHEAEEMAEEGSTATEDHASEIQDDFDNLPKEIIIQVSPPNENSDSPQKQDPESQGSQV